MLNITGLNRFFFVRDFHYMRCKYDKVLSIIHQQLDCEPEDGDVFIVMSKDLRLVRLFSYGQMSRMSLTNWLEKDSTHLDRKSTRLNSSHWNKSRMPSSA